MSNDRLLYLKDFSECQRIELGTIVPSADDLFAFACAFDPQRFHVDPEVAARSPFRGLVANGCVAVQRIEPSPAISTGEHCGRSASYATRAAPSCSRWC